jgi:hypothetical protein
MADDKTAAGANPPEDLKAKANRLLAGNPVEFEKAMANATPTEKEALMLAKREHDAANKPFTFAAVPGGAFAADGAGFGASGTITVNGVTVPTTRWADHTIRGTLPLGVSQGPVVIQSGSRTLRGVWGPAPAAPPAAPSTPPKA